MFPRPLLKRKQHGRITMTLQRKEERKEKINAKRAMLHPAAKATPRGTRQTTKHASILLKITKSGIANTARQKTSTQNSAIIPRKSAFGARMDQ